VTGDDGCGQELKNWYDMLRKSAIWQAEQQVKPDTKPVPKKLGLRLTDLPKDCATVIAAGGNTPVVAADVSAVPALVTALASKEAGPPVPVLDQAALKTLISGGSVMTETAAASGMPLPDRNPIR